MRIAAVVHNGVRHDARVLKSASTLKAQGHDVRIFGLTPEATEEFDLPLSWLISLVREDLVADGGDEFLLVRADLGRDGLGSAVDRDVRGAQGSQLLQDVVYGATGAVLDESRDGQGGEHDGQVSFDRVSLPVEHRPGPQVCLAHPE